MNDEEAAKHLGLTPEEVAGTFKLIAYEDAFELWDLCHPVCVECLSGYGWKEYGGCCEHCHRKGVEANIEWENGGRERKLGQILEKAEDFKTLAAEFRAKGDEPAARNWDRRVEECLRSAATFENPTE